MAKFKRGSLTLARQVFNTPQLILADDLQNIAQYLVNRANGVEVDSGIDNAVVEKEARTQYSEQEEKEQNWRRLGITNDGTRGNLEVTGTLVAKAGNIDADCIELTSYEGLYDKFAKQVSEGIEELVLHVDSGGGAAFSCFEMAREVRDLANQKGIKIYAYIDGLAASAAYAWTSIADEVIARPDSEVGSVGVVVQLINNSKMLENIGITRQFVCHGEQKVPFTAEGDFSPQFISSIQKKVDKTGLEFSTFIAKNRGMSVQDVLSTEAEVFDSEEALSVGFVDKVMSKSEFFGNYLPSLRSTGNIFNFGSPMAADNSHNIKEESMTKEKEVPKDAEVLSNAQAKSTEQGLDSMSEKLSTQLTEMTEANQSLNSQLLEMSKKYQELEAANAELVTEMQDRELVHRTEQRQAMLEDALGKDNESVATLLSSTESLSDEAFEVVAKSLSGNQDSMQKSLEEKGGEGQEAVKQLDLAEQMKQKAQAMYGRKA